MRRLLLLPALLLIAGLAFASTPENFESPQKARLAEAEQALNTLQAEVPHLKVYQTGPMVTRLYGNSFANGFSPEATARGFVDKHASIFGVAPSDLVPGRPDKSELSSQPVMWLPEENRYRFMLEYYSQQSNGIPVFRSELRVLVRNEADYPAVLAVSTLKDLDGFEANSAAKGGQYPMALAAAQADEPSLTDFTDQEIVVYAGDADHWERPRMAATFIGSNDFPEKYRFVVDINSGEILLKENMIIFEDVEGQVEGNVTQGNAADFCELEIPEPFRWARVNIGGEIAYSDSLGNFTIPNTGTDPVTVESRAWGTWFKVTDYSGNDLLLTSEVTPPGPVSFMHNQMNGSESVRAQANAYVEANVVREYALAGNPAYPQLQQNEFPVSTNRTDGYCPGNAWYDYSSINFCLSGGDYPNTAWSSVIHHEYGHHLVDVGGSGQDQYGEGMADATAVLIADHPYLGDGFYGTCGEPLRNADNDFQYPCTGGAHTCGQLLSGCVWDTRNELAAGAHSPDEYLSVIRPLTVNSILLHTGTEITPQITIDFLTLDDDDDNLANGTPHYYQIAAGFGAHNMDAPPLALLVFEYPEGLPNLLSPGQPTSFELVVSGQEAIPEPGTAMLYYRVDGGGYTSVALTETSPNHYDVTLPALDCYQVVDYYFTAETSDGQTVYDPEPGDVYSTFVATEEVVAFSDNFESDMGWTISGGEWERGAPVGNGGTSYGNPDPTDAVSGDNVLGYDLSNDGDYEASIPEYHITSPAIDCSDLVNGKLRFWAWLNVEQPMYDHAYVRISNNGTSWTTIWENTETIEDNSWSEWLFDVSTYVDGQPTVYLRFTMGSTDGAWQYSGWNLDDVELVGYSCEDQALQIVTQELPDWTVDIAYSQQLVADNVTGNATWTDKNDDLAGTGLSLSPDGVVSGTPTDDGPISFIAMVTDEAKATTEQQFDFMINPEVQIGTLSLPEWTEGIEYSHQLLVSGGTGTHSWIDQGGGLNGTGLLLTADGILIGTPGAPGPIVFTAHVDDEVGAWDDRELTFLINPSVGITTTSLPDANQGTAYSQTLAAGGGTGELTWIETTDELSTVGLNLDHTGLINGTPSDVQIVTFTVAAEDEVGSQDLQELTIDIRPSYVCGDISGNGVGPDIEDLTYLVAYMFQEGPPPPQMGAADVDGTGALDIQDLIYLVEYMFNDGPDLICE